MGQPLSMRTVEIRLGKLDQKTSDKLVAHGTIVSAINVEQIKTGRYQRRPGSSFLVGLTGAKRAFAYGDELLLGTDSELYSSFAGALTQRGQLAQFQARHSPISNSVRTQTEHDTCATADYFWDVWHEEGRGLFYSVRRKDNGAYVVAGGTIEATSTMSRPRIVAFTDHVVVFYVDYVYNAGTGTGGGEARAVRIPIATPATPDSPSVIEISGTPYFIMPDGASPGGRPESFDVIAKDGTTACLVSAGKDGVDATTRITFVEWSVSSKAITASQQETSTEFSFLGETGFAFSFLGISGGLYHVAYTRRSSSGGWAAGIRHCTAGLGLAGSIVRTHIWTESGTTGAHELRNVTGWVDGSGTQHIVSALESTAAEPRAHLRYHTRTSGGTITDLGTMYGYRLSGRAFSLANRDLVLVSGTNDSAAGDINTLFALDVVAMAAVGKSLPSIAEMTHPRRGWLPGVVVGSDSIGSYARAANVYKLTIDLTGATEIALRPQGNRRWVEAAGMTLVPGSFISAYDGVGSSELGFHFRPDLVSLANGGSGSRPNGNYAYRLCWAWLDSKGQIHRSDPSDPEVHNQTAGGSSQVTIRSLPLTAKTPPLTKVFCEVYRTTINPSDANVADYFLATTIENDPSTANLVIASENMLDATLTTKERLYTLGNTVQANTSPPPADGLAVWKNRVWAWERDFLHFSKLIKDGFGLAFNNENFLKISDDRGDIIAVAPNGARLLAFKKRGVYEISGEGPDDLGRGEFAEPQQINSTLGARSATSVYSSDVGVFFQDHATGGIWLFPVGGGPAEHVGDPVDTLLGGSGGFDVVDIAFHATKRQVQFFADFLTLVYDIERKRWYEWNEQPAVSAADVSGAVYYVTDTGDVRYENQSVWREGEGSIDVTSYSASIELGKLAFSGIGGYQRLYEIQAIGEKLGEHVLWARLKYRYTSDEDIEAFDTADMAAGSPYIIGARPQLKNQLATAFSVVWQDISPNNAGWAIDAFSARVGVRGAGHRVPSVNIAEHLP